LYPIVWWWGFELLAQAKGESFAAVAVHGYGLDLHQLLLQVAFDGV
jgi:hypothetical protein